MTQQFEINNAREQLQTSTSVAQYDVVLCGSYGHGNLGDDVLMVAYYHALTAIIPPEGCAILLHGATEYLATLLPQACIIRQDQANTVRTDVLVHGGGTIWYSFAGQNPISSLFRRILRKLKLIKRNDSQHAQLLLTSERTFAVGIGLGPFALGTEGTARMRAEACEFIAVRDYRSLSYCQNWGIARVCMGADVAFLPELWLEDATALTVNPATDHVSIGVVVRDWAHDKRGSAYWKVLHAAVQGWRSDGISVTYLLLAPDSDTKCRQDLDVAQESYRCWEPGIAGGFAPFIRELAKFDIIISARYHGVILAAVLGITSVAIDIEPKLPAAAEMLGEGCLLWAQPFEIELLRQHVATLLREKKQRTTALMEVVQEQRVIATRMITALYAALVERNNENENEDAY